MNSVSWFDLPKLKASGHQPFSYHAWQVVQRLFWQNLVCTLFCEQTKLLWHAVFLCCRQVKKVPRVPESILKRRRVVAASKHRALKEALAFKKVCFCSVGNLCSQISLPALKDTVAWGAFNNYRCHQLDLWLA